LRGAGDPAGFREIFQVGADFGPAPLFGVPHVVEDDKMACAHGGSAFFDHAFVFCIEFFIGKAVAEDCRFGRDACRFLPSAVGEVLFEVDLEIIPI